MSNLKVMSPPFWRSGTSSTSSFKVCQDQYNWPLLFISFAAQITERLMAWQTKLERALEKACIRPVPWNELVRIVRYSLKVFWKVGLKFDRGTFHLFYFLYGKIPAIYDGDEDLHCKDFLKVQWDELFEFIANTLLDLTSVITKRARYIQQINFSGGNITLLLKHPYVWGY